MATCKDCFHNEACVDMLELMGYIVNGDGIDADKRCNQFINASDVAPVVHGHYVFDDDGDSSCSVCREKYLDHTQKYCPNCGAKLDGKDGES